MVSLSLAALLCAAAAPAEPLLLHFSTAGCVPCRQMEPVVARLEQAGYPVRHVRHERDAELCRRFRVQDFPTFIVLSGGQEVARRKGKLELAELEQLLAQAGLDRESPRAPGDATVRETEADFSRLVRSTVRLTVDDRTGTSHGSGTIIDERQGCALVLTCGHIFRDSKGQGKITVELFGPRGPQPLEGELLKFDLDRDLGLVVIRPTTAVCAAKVAPRGYRLKRGDRVVSVGCDHGREPTPIASRVSATDKFLGHANVEVAGQPVQGRSGGGLFSEDGLVVGVCNAADPADDEGLYAAGSTIQDQLDACGLAELYENSPTRLAVNRGDGAAPSAPATRVREASESARGVRVSESRTRAAVAAASPAGGSAPWALAGAGPAAPPSMPPEMPASLAVGSESNDSASVSISPTERLALDALRGEAGDAEVICIIRPLGKPGARNRVVVLDRASTAFLSTLAQEQRSQDGRHLTSLDVERPGPNPEREEAPSRPTAIRPARESRGGFQPRMADVPPAVRR